MIPNHQFTNISTLKIETSLGNLIAFTSPDKLFLLQFEDAPMLLKYKEKFKIQGNKDLPHNNLQEQLRLELNDYFAGKRTRFSIPIAPLGTLFQQTVWGHLQNIPFATTTSYKNIAHTIENPQAQRAVAQALGANNILILIPCHRVIEDSGSLGGFSSGIERKRWLLTHEKSYLKHAQQ